MATFAFDDCKDMNAGEECEAECAAGHDGIITATCRPDGTFAVAGSCRPSRDDDRQREVDGDRAPAMCAASLPGLSTKLYCACIDTRYSPVRPAQHTQALLFPGNTTV